MPKNPVLFAANTPITREGLIAALRSPASGLSAAHANKIISYVTRALTAARCEGQGESDLRLALANLDQLESTRRLHADAPAACRQARALATGATGTQRLTLPTDRTLLPNAWEALVAFAPVRERSRTRSRLITLARVTAHLGRLTTSPAIMPSVTELRSAAPAVGISPNTVDSALAPYRRLRAAAVRADPENASQFGVLPDGRKVRGRSATAVLAMRGECSNELDPRAVIERLAPTFHKQLIKYADNPVVRAKIHVDGTMRANLQAAARLVGDLLVHAPDVLPTFEIGALWRTMRPLNTATGSTEEWHDPTGDEVAVPLARWLVERVTPGVRARVAPAATTGFPTMILADLKAWQSLTEWAHGAHLRKTNPERWQEWRGHYRTLRQYVVETPVPEELQLLRKDKERIVELFTMSHVWCVWIPVLFREAERLLDRVEAEIAAASRARPGVDSRDVPAVAAAIAAFASQVEGTLLVALVFYDGMRATQYHLGRYGRHLTPERDVETGAWVALATRWRGARLETARTKQAVSRARLLGPGLLPPRLLEAYVRLVRAPRLEARGVTRADAVAPNGRFPFFVSPDRAAPAPFAFSQAHLCREVLGPVLYRMATEFAGYTLGDATCYADVDRRLCFGALSFHVARYANATGCEKTLNDRELGRELTSDRSDQFERKYVVHSWLPCGAEGTWTHASSYRAWLESMARTPATAAFPLDSIPDRLLPPSIRRLFAKWADVDRAAARRAKRSRHGSPSGTMRRARPDVAARNRASAAARAAGRIDE